MRDFNWVSGRAAFAQKGQFRPVSVWLMIWLLSAAGLHGQTAQTGALTGIVTDPTGRVVAGVTLTVTSASTGQARTSVTQSNGKYMVSLLPPDAYKVEITSKDFKKFVFERVTVNVTETTVVNAQLQVGSVAEIVTIRAEPQPLDVTSPTLGHVTDQQIIESMPLVTRNYTQILGLSPGVSGEVNNAGHIGRGDTSSAASTGGYSVGGNATNDNNFQMNGTQVDDLAGEADISGGVPVPNPDAIQEFKVQVGQYDASYGRNAGANVDVVTKSGTNQFHGDVWEYFRNTALNANDYFLKRNNQPRAVLNQNQFGFTVGGPVVKDKAMFFLSYQGTRERDGLDQQAGCLTSGTIPPQFTDANSRTATSLATTFNGEQGLLGGQINSASDISPIALAVLNAQLTDGKFVVPAPQNSRTGNTVLSAACKYRDDQVIGNLDFYHTDKSRLAAKFFGMNSDRIGAFPNNQLGLDGVITVPGFPLEFINHFRDISLTHTYAFNDHFLNQAIIGFHRLVGQLGQNYPNVNFANTPACPESVPGTVTLTSLCVPAAPAFDNPYPDIVVSSFADCSFSTCPANFDVGGNGQGLNIAQNYYDLSDSIVYVHGKHSLHFGGGVNQSQINFERFHFFGGLLYPSVPDFLLGNAFLSIDVPGVFDRAWRTWDGNAYIQDNYQIVPRLSVNLGLRYERQGQLGEYHGRASTFDPGRADPNPPSAGTLDGFIVASNFSGGAIPPGVIKSRTNTAINNEGQNAFEPRIGFSWQLPGTNRVVLRGGYGLFVTRTTSEPFVQLVGAPPWGEIRQIQFPDPAQPFPAAPPFPIFTPYTPPVFPGQPFGSDLTPTVFSLHFRPPVLQRYSMTLQTAFAKDWTLEVGYQGSRGTKLLQGRSFNQAALASASNPIRGQTTNIVPDLVTGDPGNVGLRVPIEGFDPAFSTFIESAGASWFNALGASVSKRFSHGLQLLASYTWASALETNPFYTTGAFTGGARLGDQNSARANYGFDDFVRPQRFVLSYLYELPSFKSGSALKTRVLSGWSVAGVATFQNGQKLTITETNSLNAFGITNSQGDRAQLAQGCTNSSLVTRGSVTSKLDNYFNASCFTLPSVIGDDGLATAFGNAGNGIVSGPDQRNFDISVIKKIPLTESKVLEFRTEFFNAFNTPSFANPSLNAGTVTQDFTTGLPTFEPDLNFGKVSETSVAPRIIQFALKLYF